MDKEKKSQRYIKAAELEAKAKALRRQETAFWQEVEERLSDIVEVHKADLIKLLTVEESDKIDTKQKIAVGQKRQEEKKSIQKPDPAETKAPVISNDESVAPATPATKAPDRYDDTSVAVHGVQGQSPAT